VRLSESTVRGLAARGELLAEGWPLKIKRAEIEAYVARSRIKPGDLGPTCGRASVDRPDHEGDHRYPGVGVPR
jgi:hypothetical protein